MPGNFVDQFPNDCQPDCANRRNRDFQNALFGTPFRGDDRQNITRIG